MLAEYAQVVKMLGSGRLEAACFDGTTRLAHIRGKMRKKVWIGAGDIILVSLREYQDEKVDVIHKYTADEARALKTAGELPESAKINETVMEMAADSGEDDCAFEFDDVRVSLPGYYHYHPFFFRFNQCDWKLLVVGHSTLLLFHFLLSGLFVS